MPKKTTPAPAPVDDDQNLQNAIDKLVAKGLPNHFVFLIYYFYALVY